MRVRLVTAAALVTAALMVSAIAGPPRAVADEPSSLGQIGGRAHASAAGTDKPSVTAFESAPLAGDFRPVRLIGPAGAVQYEPNDPQAKNMEITPRYLATQAGPLSHTSACGTDEDLCKVQKDVDQVETLMLQRQGEQVVREAIAQQDELARQPGIGRPGPAFDAVAAGEYRAMAISNLDYLREQGVVLKGHSRVSVQSRPGDRRPGSDPRLTMWVCVNNSQMGFAEKGLVYYGSTVNGLLYLAVVEGRVKLVSADLNYTKFCY